MNINKNRTYNEYLFKYIEKIAKFPNVRELKLDLS